MMAIVDYENRDNLFAIQEIEYYQI